MRFKKIILMLTKKSSCVHTTRRGIHGTKGGKKAWRGPTGRWKRHVCACTGLMLAPQPGAGGSCCKAICSHKTGGESTWLPGEECCQSDFRRSTACSPALRGPTAVRPAAPPSAQGCIGRAKPQLRPHRPWARPAQAMPRAQLCGRGCPGAKNLGTASSVGVRVNTPTPGLATVGNDAQLLRRRCSGRLGSPRLKSGGARSRLGSASCFPDDPWQSGSFMGAPLFSFVSGGNTDV